MIVGLMIMDIYAEHYTTRIFWTIFGLFWHITHFGCTLIWGQYTSQRWKMTKCTARWTRPNSGGILKIGIQPKWWLYQSFVDLTKLNWSIIWALSISDDCISQQGTNKNICTTLLQSTHGCSLGWSSDIKTVSYILLLHGIVWLELCCAHRGILAELDLAWNVIVLMDSRENVILCWLPGLGRILITTWVLKSQTVHVWYMKYPKVHWWGILPFDNSTTEEISMLTWRFWTKLVLM